MFCLVNIAMHCLQTIPIYWNVTTGTLNSWKRLNQSWSFWHQQGGESRKGLKKTAAVNEGRGWHGLDSVLSFGILVTGCQGWHEHWQCCIFCECGRASCTLWPRLKYTLASMCVPMCDDGEVWILEKPGDWSSTTKDQFLGWIFPGFNRSLLYHTCNYINSRDGNQDLELRGGFSQDIFFGGEERVITDQWALRLLAFSSALQPCWETSSHASVATLRNAQYLRDGGDYLVYSAYIVNVVRWGGGW